MDEKLIVVQKNGNICTVLINRPKAMNALNTALLNELELVVDSISKDLTIKVVLITGEGKAFVAGADISEMVNLSSLEARAFAALGMRVFKKIEQLEIPVIAAVNGFALGGGCELAMAADIRLASKKAKFGQPEVGLGITPGFAGTQRLPRLVGVAKAKELIFTGAIINADEAKLIGLVNQVCDPEELLNSALDMANNILKNSSIAVSFSKTAINKSFDLDIESGMELERDLFALCFATEDQKEGMQAFLAKRKPEFK